MREEEVPEDEQFETHFMILDQILNNQERRKIN